MLTGLAALVSVGLVVGLVLGGVALGATRFLGIGEDPATGSAAASACGYLAGHATPERLAEGWVIEQGVEMGRPSTIHVGAVLRGPELVAATVGGRAVRVGRGTLEL